jgi:hypothetical protein
VMLGVALLGGTVHSASSQEGILAVYFAS